jgi:PIN domain nuclease of toxin-antitoxin system
MMALTNAARKRQSQSRAFRKYAKSDTDDSIKIKLAHNDPFDRLLLAQCEVETLRLVTADQTLAKLPAVIAVSFWR